MTIVYLEGLTANEVKNLDVRQKQDITFDKESDVATKQTSIESQLSSQSYVVRKHYCHHDENPPRPCTVEIIKTVTATTAELTEK